MPPADLSPLNNREYRKLLLSLTLNAQRLDLLIAISDDRNLQDQLITAYEADLKAQGITTLRARLDPKRPSLRATLEELAAQTPALQAGEPAVVTVLNAGELLGVRLSDEKSEQEKFFFSLQWTREALRNFEFPIVLWLPDAVATRLAQQAPDFWSWRGGVFEFVAEARVPERGGALSMPSREMGADATGSPIAIEDLQQQIAQLEQTAPDSPLLITLYNNLGEAYEKTYNYAQALEIYGSALTLANSKSDISGQARSLLNLGNTLRDSGRSIQSLSYYQQALAKYHKLSHRSGEKAALNQVGVAYFSLGQYPQSVESYQKSLEISREIGDQDGETASLCNLGSVYFSLGQYPQAIESYQKSLKISREIGDQDGEANSLGNLGLVHIAQGNYRQAIEYHQQRLSITREIGDRLGEAASLSNLGIAYSFLGDYQQAINYHQQCLAIFREIGDRKIEANSLGGLGLAYGFIGQHQESIKYYKQSLEVAREIQDRRLEAHFLGNLGGEYNTIGQYFQARNHHQQSLEIAREIGDRHCEAVALFNIGNTLAKTDQKWEARSAYEEAKDLYAKMGLEKKVNECEVALFTLGQKVVMVPKPAPTIGEAPPKEPDWLAKSMPTPQVKNTAPRPRQVPVVAWFVAGLGLAGLLWWLLR